MDGREMIPCQWLVAREDGLLQVEDVVSEIVHRAGDIVYKHHLQRRVVPYAVQRAKAEMLSAVEWLFLQHDNASNCFNSEPTPCPVDSWARGVLVCSYPTPLPKDQILSQSTTTTTTSTSTTTVTTALHKSVPNPSTETKQPTDSLTKSTPTKKSHPVNTPTVEANSRTTRNTNHANHTSAHRTAKDSTISASNAPQSPPSHSIPHPGGKSEGKHSLKQKNTISSSPPTVKESSAKEDEMEKFAKFKRDIRGRDYFYDYRGNVIIVNQTDYDKPSTNKVNMKVTIEKTSETEANKDNIHHDTPTNTKMKRNDHAKDHKRHQNQSPSDSSTNYNAYYKEIKLSQPSMDASIVKVSPGVTLHAVEKKKEVASGGAVTSLRPARKKGVPPQPPQPPQPVQPSQPSQHVPQKSEMFPAIPIPHPIPVYNTQATLTLSPTALYGSTQKLWTTEMLTENFNSLLPSIKPKVPPSPKLGSLS